jgi:uncharacterized protein YhbP (UPF0306 family)
MTIRDAIVQYLDKAQLLHVATISDGQVWCATVFFAADNTHNLYWLSPPTARHSREISSSGRVAGTIALPIGYGQPMRGLQVEGKAREVSMSDTDKFYQAYAERYSAHGRLSQIMQGLDDNRLYQLEPTLFVLYDEDNFAAEPRQEWHPGAGDGVVKTAEEVDQAIVDNAGPKDAGASSNGDSRPATRHNLTEGEFRVNRADTFKHSGNDDSDEEQSDDNTPSDPTAELYLHNEDADSSTSEEENNGNTTPRDDDDSDESQNGDNTDSDSEKY